MKTFLLLLFCGLAYFSLATPAPNFSIVTSDNQAKMLYQDYISQGKAVVIEMFFTTCPPCGTHAPHFQSLYTQMQVAHQGRVEFLLLSVLGSDTNVKVAQYKTSKGLSMPGAGSDGGSLTALQPYMSNQFGEYQGTPTFLVIAPNTGEVHFDIRGNSATATMALLSQKLSELLPPLPCTIQDNFGNPIENAEIRVVAPTLDSLFIADGSYSLDNLPALDNTTYSITINNNIDNPLNGVTTYDLVLMSKHILAIEELKCEWQQKASDVNRSGTITTSDVVACRKVILGINQNFPFGGWLAEPDTIWASNGACSNFVLTKYGDVNGHVCVYAAPDPDVRSTFDWEAVDETLAAGQTTTIKLVASQAMALEGFQLPLYFDSNKLKINNIQSSNLPGFSSDAYSLPLQKDGFGRISYINLGMEATQALQVQPVLELNVTALESGLLSDMLHFEGDANIFPAEIYSKSNVQNLNVIWRKSNFIQPQSLLFPNPNKGDFELQFTNKTEGNKNLQVIDNQGRLVFSRDIFAPVGAIQIPVHVSDAPQGLYLVKFDGGVMGKVLIVK
jgi:peroxiredoxin